ncbi:DUF397 domain-containing protein [Streptomyces sp. TRM 70361]|uniref:DUF397 domain-containing protein n=1 Tax=Streptomyces sp. TRM 70361 TaxID=3116553 RepID=UPI002E7B1703|nr:DUF397 domain-containing protein [Streptomyces sp. TRM 70361]MEE1939748.1 DUF397 domain-containing protein [Streptomyces sp. TRM 70361]
MSTADLAWFKSSYSGSQGGECVEVAVEWRAPGSGERGGTGPADGRPTGAAARPGTVHIRDSKGGRPSSLAFTPGAWSAFLRTARG